MHYQTNEVKDFLSFLSSSQVTNSITEMIQLSTLKGLIKPLTTNLTCSHGRKLLSMIPDIIGKTVLSR